MSVSSPENAGQRRLDAGSNQVGTRKIRNMMGEKGGSPIFRLGYNHDKASFDIFWLRDESLEESDNLPDPDVLAQEIVEDLDAALEQFPEIADDLRTPW